MIKKSSLLAIIRLLLGGAIGILFIKFRKCRCNKEIET